MSATSIDLSQIKTDALSAASTFRTLIGLGTSDTPTFKAATLSAGTLNGTVLDIAQTWGGTGTYTGIKYNVTDSGPSNAASLLMDLQVGGVSKVKIQKNAATSFVDNSVGVSIKPLPSALTFAVEWISSIYPTLGSRIWSYRGGGSYVCVDRANDTAENLNISGNLQVGEFYNTVAERLYVNGTSRFAGTIEQRNGTNQQRFNLYGTYDSNGTNYRRLYLDSTTAGAFKIGVEGLGTGASGNTLELQTGGTSRLTIDASGNLTGAALTLNNSNSQNIGLDVRPWITVKDNAGTLAGYVSNGGSVFSSGASASNDLGLRAVNAFGVSVANSVTPSFTIGSTGAVGINAGTLNGTVLDIAQAWGGTGTYTGIRYNVTDSGPSNAASLLMDLQVGGVSKFKISKGGRVTVPEYIVSSVTSEILAGADGSGYYFGCGLGSGTLPLFVGAAGAGTNVFIAGTTGSLYLRGKKLAFRLSDVGGGQLLQAESSTVLSLLDSTNAQTFRIYNTFTDSSNYERAKIAWESNVLVIGSEKGGTGAVRTTTYTSSSHTIIDCANGANVYIKSRGINVLTIDGASYFIDPGTGISLGSDDDRYGNTSTLLCLSTAKIRSASARLDGTEAAPTNLTIRAGNATGRNSPTTFIVGANVVIYGGDGAINSSGAANGGHVYLDGGQGYGTGVHGSIIIGATRARLLAFGGTTSSFPAIKRNSAALNFRLADDSADCDITAAKATFSGQVVTATAALATNATSGFLYVPTCAGTPSGTPASQTGTAPIVIDTTNNKLYFYSGGAWRDAGP